MEIPKLPLLNYTGFYQFTISAGIAIIFLSAFFILVTQIYSAFLSFYVIWFNFIFYFGLMVFGSILFIDGYLHWKKWQFKRNRLLDSRQELMEISIQVKKAEREKIITEIAEKSQLVLGSGMKFPASEFEKDSIRKQLNK